MNAHRALLRDVWEFLIYILTAVLLCAGAGMVGG
jgi:hypothetical protein